MTEENIVIKFKESIDIVVQFLDDSYNKILVYEKDPIDYPIEPFYPDIPK